MRGTILSGEMESFVRRGLCLGAAAFRCVAVYGGGSDRDFYRILYGSNESAILMRYGRAREENGFYVRIAEFLRSIGIRVPRIYHHSPEQGLVLMEDLGEVSLWMLRLAPEEVRMKYYKRALKEICTLHAFPADAFPIETVPLMEGFGPALYRWERDYFRINFVAGFCRIDHGSYDAGLLEEELDALAGRLEKTGRSLIHRDFQSQNLMVLRDGIALIDFQGMRYGTCFYDLGALLYDPYAALTEMERMELLSYYYTISGSGMKWTEFQKCFREAAAQRLMQALGAFGFLGLNQGKKDFLGHIPSGVENLIDAAGRSGRLPQLKLLALNCRTAVLLGKGEK